MVVPSKRRVEDPCRGKGDRETRTYIKLYWVTRLTKARYKIMHPNNELGGPRLGRQAAVVSEVEIGARRR